MRSQREATAAEVRPREIGRWGTLTRVLLGSGLLASGLAAGPGWWDVVTAFTVVPGAITVVLAIRGRRRPPLSLLGPEGHAVNIGLLVALGALLPVPFLLLVGVSLLAAAARGDAGCEILVLPNLARGSNDRLACPVLHPLDLAESRRRSAVGGARR